MTVLWNKEDIILELPMPRSQPLECPTSPLGDDNNGNNDDDNDNASLGSSPCRSPPLDTSNPQ
jgi:hypothetical protein